MSMTYSFQKFEHENEDVIVVNANPVTTTEKLQYHHFHIIDRSGSMCGSIDRLIDNLEKVISLIDENDLITIIYFSSETQFRTIIKAAKKFDNLKNLLDTMRSTLSTTCFSEPLKEVNQIINELRYVNLPINITLFTDGVPVVPWSENEEKRRIFIELEKMIAKENRVVSINTVGYGNYYDEKLLKDIASFTEYGIFTHTNEIENYYEIFENNFVNISSNMFQTIYVNTTGEIIYLNRNFSKMVKKEMILTSLSKEKNQFFIKGKEDFFYVDGKKYLVKDIKTKAQDSTITNFLYAYAYNLYYQNKYEKSLNVLSKNIFDKYLIDSHFNAFTYDERGEHIRKLKKAMTENKNRFIEGLCDKNYLPADDATCVMDILTDLQRTESLWIPFHPLLEDYKRIGKKVIDDYDLFVKDDYEVIGSFEDLVYNKEQLNVSLRVKINGSVSINPKQAKSVGIESIWKCHIYRNYTLIKNGGLNINKIMCLVPVDKYDSIASELFSFGCMEYVKIENRSYKRILINLSSFPVINKSYVDKSMDIDSVFDVNLKLLNLECQQKIVNHHLNLIKDAAHFQKEGIFTNLNIDQIKLLEDYGLGKDGTYNAIDPKKVESEIKDCYRTRVLEFTFAGFSSIPSMKDLEERLVSGKKLTVSMDLLNQNLMTFHNEVEKAGIKLSSKSNDTREFLETKKKEIKNNLYFYRDKLAILKMGLILTGNWFDLKTDDKGNYFYEKDSMKMICKANYKTIEI